MQIRMGWRFVAFDWNRARAFLVTAEEGSFSAAARALGMSQPTLGRQVSALEEELGVTLFERVGTRLELTATGVELAKHVRVMSEAASRVSLVAAGQSLSIDGTVRIAASEAVSAYLLPPIVAEIRAQHPGVEIELVVSNQTSDLRRREADIAVRNYRPTESDLVSRKLKDSAAYLYASPVYLEKIGNPTTPEALAQRAELFGFEDHKDRLIELLNAWGLGLDRKNIPITTDNHLVQWELAKAGLGICMMMQEVGDAEPRVCRVLPELPAPMRFPTWLTSHRELKTSRRIRVVFDLLAEALARV